MLKNLKRSKMLIHAKNVRKYKNVKECFKMLQNDEKRRKFKMLRDGRTDRPTDQGVESRARD